MYHTVLFLDLQMAKLHQQRMLDMKKTFQRELRSQTELLNGSGEESLSAADPTGARQSRSPTPSAGAVALLPMPQMEVSSPDAATTLAMDQQQQHLVTMSDVNFKYLKHVIFKFFTSPNTEVRF